MSVFFEAADNFTDTVIHVFNESNKFGPFITNPFLACLHFFQPIFGWLDRGMRRIISKIEKEWGICLSLRFGCKVVDSPVGEYVGSVSFGIDVFFIEAHIVLSVATVLEVVVHHVPEEAVEVIKASRVWVGFFIESEVPFSNCGGSIALLLECLWQKSCGRGKISPVVLGVGADYSGNTNKFLVFSGKKSGTGRRANWAISIEISEAQAARHE